MNILVPDSWLKEHLKTQARPEQIAEYLSLCSQSVEKVTQINNDWVYYIEVTTNRPDCLSIYGIARELATILPRFGLKASLQPLKNTVDFNKLKPAKPLPLKVEITKSTLCPRFTALIFDKIKIRSSSKIIQERLEKSGVRALNNIVDISNYLMLELNQPMHTFDYDKIKGAKMILRQAKEGEKITTLDGITRHLPEGTIIIEDGEGRIIDLCGVMGGENSAVDKHTKRVLLFVQTYDPQRIRQECQKMAFRTEASSRFEKGVDPEGVILAMKRATRMFQENGASIASNLIDIYPNPRKPKKIKLDIRLVKKLMSVKISQKEIINILQSLGFKVKSTTHNPQLITITAPHWRHDDISIPEDLIEEIARIYGYHHLPGQIMTGEIPEDQTEPQFLWEKRVKNLLAHWGFTETLSYSLQSEEIIKKARLNARRYLKLKNPLSQDLIYLRGSLIPSLLLVLASNQAYFEEIKIFELSNIYLKKTKDLPQEKSILCGAITGKNKFPKAKGVVKALLEALGIIGTRFSPPTIHYPLWHPFKTAIIYSQEKFLGVIGEIHPQVLANFEIKNPVIIFNLDFDLLTKLATTQKTYQPPPQYPAITEDLCFLIKSKTKVGNLIQLIKHSSSLVKNVALLDSFQNQRTFRITFQHPKKTLREKEVEKVRKRIIRALEKKLRVKLKT